MIQVTAHRGIQSRASMSAPEIAIQDTSRMIVKPAMERWMIGHPQAPISPEAAQRVAAHISTRQRDRRHSWSASSAGLCLRRQELAFLGVEGYKISDPRTLRIFNNGTWTHLRWQANLLTADILDDIEKTYRRPSLNSQATLDGIGVAGEGFYKGEPYLFELKSCNEMSYGWQAKKDSPNDKTLEQVSMELWASGFEIAAVVNENKNDQSVSEWVIEREETHIRNVVTDIKQMKSDIDYMKLHPMLPECVKGNKTGEFYKCPFGTPLGACINSGSWPTGI